MRHTDQTDGPTVPPLLQEVRDVLPLVSSVTGGSRPGHVPGSSGVVPPGAICRALAPNAPLSEQPLTRLFSVYAILMGTLYHLGDKMSRGVERHCQTKSLPLCKGRWADASRLGGIVGTKVQTTPQSALTGCQLPLHRGAFFILPSPLSYREWARHTRRCACR